MFNMIRLRKFVPDVPPMQTSYSRLRESRGVESGIVVSKSMYEEFSFVADSFMLKSSDFNIDNILSVGAFDMLKPTYVTSMSSMSYADGFQDLNFEQQKSE